MPIPEYSLYVAGSSSAVPRPGRANSGYLLRTPRAAIALEFGSGSFAKLRCVIDAANELDAVVVSHMHADHFFDLIPLRYALRYEANRPARLPVYLPPGGKKVLQHVARAISDSPDFFGGVMDLQEYDAREHLEFTGCTLTFAPARHYIRAYAVRAETPGGVLAFSADTAPCEDVALLAADADIFLCEAALGSAGTESSDDRGHCNAAEAGELAAASRARRLVLTHYGANDEPQALLAAASRTFGGATSVADDGLQFALGQQA